MSNIESKSKPKFGDIVSSLGPIGEIGGLVLDTIGLFMGKKAAEEAERQRQKELQEQIERQQLAGFKEERRFSEQLGLKKRELREARKERERAWKWKEEERDYSRKNQFVSNFIGMLNADTQLKNRLINIWGK